MLVVVGFSVFRWRSPVGSTGPGREFFPNRALGQAQPTALLTQFKAQQSTFACHTPCVGLSPVQSWTEHSVYPDLEFVQNVPYEYVASCLLTRKSIAFWPWRSQSALAENHYPGGGETPETSIFCPQGRIINREVQLRPQVSFRERVLYYWAYCIPRPSPPPLSVFPFVCYFW